MSSVIRVGQDNHAGLALHRLLTQAIHPNNNRLNCKQCSPICVSFLFQSVRIKYVEYFNCIWSRGPLLLDTAWCGMGSCWYWNSCNYESYGSMKWWLTCQGSSVLMLLGPAGDLWRHSSLQCGWSRSIHKPQIQGFLRRLHTSWSSWMHQPQSINAWFWIAQVIFDHLYSTILMIEIKLRCYLVQIKCTVGT